MGDPCIGKGSGCEPGWDYTSPVRIRRTGHRRNPGRLRQGRCRTLGM